MGNSQELSLGGGASFRSCTDSSGDSVPQAEAPWTGPTSVKIITLSGPDSLSGEVRNAWQDAIEGQRLAGGTASPFLGPSLAAAVASNRPDVRVVVGFDGDEPRRFLPVHVSGRGRARPLAGRFCDMHGPVGVTGPEVFREMLKGAGLRSWSFRRCPDRGALASHFIFAETVSHIIRTDRGVEGLRGGLLESTSQLKQALRKERKLAKEVGPLRFEFDHQDHRVLDQLLAWKGDQRRRSGSANILEEAWASDTLRSLHDAPDRDGDATADGRGRMSVLWAGDKLVAAHFGLADQRRMHWWIPTYAPEFSAYSPGLALLLNLIRECHTRGIEALDLGHGDERYKSGFATDRAPLYSGSVDGSGIRLALGATGFRLRDAVRRSRLEPGWTATKRVLRRARSARRSS